jgi:hypothetical protein
MVMQEQSGMKDGMRWIRWGRRYGFVVVALAALCGGGCGTQSPDQEIKSIIKSINDSNGKRLANLYSMYQQRHEFKGPPDEAAFKKFIAAVSPAQLEAMGISTGDVDKLFVSERDGQPFEVRYAASRSPGVGGHQAVVFESKGAGGKVAVFMTGPKVVQADAADVAAFRNGDRDEVSGGGPPPPPKDVRGS